MITEDYVSFEVAKLLKEKGFNEYCRTYYTNSRIGFHDIYNSPRLIDNKSLFEMGLGLSAPTLQMAMKWLREEHNKIIVPSIRVMDPITGIIDCYCVGIYYIPKNNGGALCFISTTPENGYSSYEEACEAAIKYCLENLMNK